MLYINHNTTIEKNYLRFYYYYVRNYQDLPVLKIKANNWITIVCRVVIRWTVEPLRGEEGHKSRNVARVHALSLR